MNAAKAMERILGLERMWRNLRRNGSGTVRWLSWELGRPSSARSLRGSGSIGL